MQISISAMSECVASCSRQDSTLSKENLCVYGWYWGSASKDEVSMAMEVCTIFFQILKLIQLLRVELL